LPDSEERGFLSVRKQYLRPLHPTRRFASRAGVLARMACQQSRLSRAIMSTNSTNGMVR